MINSVGSIAILETNGIRIRIRIKEIRHQIPKQLAVCFPILLSLQHPCIRFDSGIATTIFFDNSRPSLISTRVLIFDFNMADE